MQVEGEGEMSSGEACGMLIAAAPPAQPQGLGVRRCSAWYIPIVFWY